MSIPMQRFMDMIADAFRSEERRGKIGSWSITETKFGFRVWASVKPDWNSALVSREYHRAEIEGTTVMDVIEFVNKQLEDTLESESNPASPNSERKSG